VVDNGRGLDPSMAERAFEPFVTMRLVPDATGLGLTAARIIARNHAGDLTLDSSANGCTATLRFPLESQT
jgi:two-component system NtrC family sensor kinase